MPRLDYNFGQILEQIDLDELLFLIDFESRSELSSKSFEFNQILEPKIYINAKNYTLHLLRAGIINTLNTKDYKHTFKTSLQFCDDDR